MVIGAGNDAVAKTDPLPAIPRLAAPARVFQAFAAMRQRAAHFSDAEAAILPMISLCERYLSGSPMPN
jgi:hypothetical protein